MKKYLTLILILFVAGLTGCSGTAYIPPEYLSNDVKDTLQNFNGAVADTSTLRDLAFWKARQNYDKQVASVPDKTEISFEMKKEDGVTYILPKIVIQKAPKFQPIPDGPKDHPVWGVAKQWGSDLMRYGLIGFGLHEVIGGYTALADHVGNEYHGPVQMTGSYNSAGRDNYVEANDLKMDQGHRDNSPGCSNGNCDGEEDDTANGKCDPAFIATIPGCSSCGSFMAGRCSVKPGDPGVPF